VIDMSTISAHAARAIGARVAEDGCRFVDAPVSGGEEAAVSGQLSIMVGGDEPAVSAAVPLLRELGTRIVHVGPIGAGQVAKTCNQLVVLATIEIVAEALVLARAASVDPARVREAMLGGFASSRVLDTHGRRMLDGDFTPGGRARLHVKDVNAVHDLSDDRVPTPAFDAAAATLERLLERGRGDLDHSALVTVIEEAAGITVRTASEGRTQ
jgi:2-hydroxy-3-oxopropionate reductase